MTELRYLFWMLQFVPFYAGGVVAACLLAAIGAPGWAVALPTVAGLGVGLWRGPRA